MRQLHYLLFSDESLSSPASQPGALLAGLRASTRTRLCPLLLTYLELGPALHRLAEVVVAASNMGSDVASDGSDLAEGRGAEGGLDVHVRLRGDLLVDVRLGSDLHVLVGLIALRGGHGAH